jgi:predicted ester cyclase
MSEHRTAQDVLDDHLLTSLNGTLEDDLERNYADDVTIVSNWGVEHGHDGIRRMAQLLRSQLPDCTFTYRMRIVDGETGLLSWTAESPAGMVEDGVDSYCIRDGRIQAQTIYYTVRPGP